MTDLTWSERAFETTRKATRNTAGTPAERSDKAAGHSPADSVPRSYTLGVGNGEQPLYADVAALLNGGLPEPPKPALLRRDDGRHVFYKGQVNLLFGDAESGKTLVSQAAASEALIAGRRVLFIDLDHNGIVGTVCRFIDFGVPEERLANQDHFRYVEPEDNLHLLNVVADAAAWRPAVAVVDSVGELLPSLRLSSNSPDDFTLAHTKVLKPLAMAGACVLAIDHLPKNPDARSSGPTGTTAKRRAIGGVSIRVSINEPFAPGRKGSCFLQLNKDRHGGLRKWCSTDGKEPVVGLFELDSTTGDLLWNLRPGATGDTAKVAGIHEADVAALSRLDPPPGSVRDVKDRMGWGSTRAAAALSEWRSRNVPEEQGTAA